MVYNIQYFKNDIWFILYNMLIIIYDIRYNATIYYIMIYDLQYMIYDICYVIYDIRSIIYNIYNRQNMTYEISYIILYT